MSLNIYNAESALNAIWDLCNGAEYVLILDINSAVDIINLLAHFVQVPTDTLNSIWSKECE